MDESALLEELVRQLQGKKFCVLTGAGCSTESGIPDYRGEGTAKRARNPIQFKQFVGDPAGRRRYWARAMLGFARFMAAEPNGAHRALARLEHAGLLSGLITQNVDRLHQRAGSRQVVELHGALAEVICLSCGDISSRSALQRRLQESNPGFLEHLSAMAPDGDADILVADEAGLLREFVVSDCALCGGVLKPHVVFFGEGVPRARVDAAFAMQQAAAALLVVGSSLTVFSGYRFPRQAAQQGLPIFIINRGASRGDPLASLRIDASASDVLQGLAARLVPQADAASRSRAHRPN